MREEFLSCIQGVDPENVHNKVEARFLEGGYKGDALATAEQLSRLAIYINDTLTGMAGELRRGSISADPWFRSENENACLTCDYYDACRFDEQTEGWHYKASMKAPEFWARLEEREKGEGPCP